MAVAEPKLLWTPSSGADRAHHADALPARGSRRSAAWRSRATTTCGAGRCPTSRGSGARWSSSSGFGSPRRAERVLGNDSDAGREVVPGLAAELRRAHVRRQGPLGAALSSTRPSRASWIGMTWGELRALTASIAAGLRASGVGEGDRVAAYMPNIPETVAALFACASIGAVWSSAAPEFGVAERGRSLRADRAEGAAGDRRLPLRRQGLRPARRGDADRGRDPVAVAGRPARVPGRLGLGGRLPGIGGGARVRAAVRSTTRCGCCTRRGRPGCPSRSSTARAGSCSST